MKKHADKAAKELEDIGAPVYRHLAGEWDSHFIIGAELRDRNDKLYCDYYREEVREYEDEDGVIHNKFGIRDEVNEILEKHGLYAEWINPGQVGVYDI